MHVKNTLLILLLLLFSLSASADNFVVTNNADSGPGTLREALTLAAANGSTVKDYITFNFADQSEAGRTVNVPLNLPPLSPNLVIDGSTQPGSVFGQSNARVKIVNTYTDFSNSNEISIFKGASCGDITISGLWLISKFQYAYQKPLIDINGGGNINITHCLIEAGIIKLVECASDVIKNNIMGYLPDGDVQPGLGCSSIIVNNTPNSIIGGSITEGNIISGGIRLINYHHIDQTNYIISNNRCGADFSGTTSSDKLWTEEERILVATDYYENAQANLGNATGQIINNLVVNYETIGIFVQGNGRVDIKGNCINTDKTGTINFEPFAPNYYFLGPTTYRPTGIYILLNTKAIIGGSLPGDANVIGNVSLGVVEQQASEVVITQNSIFCVATFYGENPHYFFGTNDLSKKPDVKITSNTGNSVSGTATPGARVELFYDSKDGDCKNCSPRNFMTAVTADAQGNWSYTGAVSPTLIASAIYNNQTSYFTEPAIDISHLKVIQPHCGSKGGISGVQFFNAAAAKWVDENDRVISTSLDVNDLSPGKYKLKIGTANCGAESDWIQIVDDKPIIDVSAQNIIQPSCNLNGSISGIKVSVGTNEPLKYVWIDAANTQIATTLDIANVPAGKYTLLVTGAANGCTQTYGPVTLQNVTGPTIDQTSVIIKPTNCGEATGSIKGITATTGSGALKYSWKNQDQKEVATTADLINQPAGTYTLQVKDDSQCGSIFTSAMVIPQLNGITLDDANVQIGVSSCSTPNGSVKNIQITGATTFKWTNAANDVVGSTINLLDVPEGDYTLIASNNYGCSQTKTYHIGTLPATIYPSYPNMVILACYGQNNGKIVVTSDALVKSARWTDNAGQTIASGLTADNLATGVYQLYLTDQNGCERFYDKYEVKEIPQLKIVNGSQQILNDNCDLKAGSIKNILVTGGVPPYTYSWTSANGNAISSSADATNLGSGSYTLTVHDGGVCEPVSATYAVQNQDNVIAIPIASDVQACSAGNIVLKINNVSSAYRYRVYDTENSTNPLIENTNGVFNLQVKANRNYYVSQLSGDCESLRSAVKVSVGLSVGDIPNAFTPNGDGVNDYWKIPGIENSPSASVKIFSRYGNKVFESIGYTHQFDGKVNGKDLPVGSYYYIIDMGSGCNILSGALTLVR